jgi:small neutral amino acid transporter SnatA (MarC family)
MAYAIALQKEAPPDSLGIVSASARSMQLAALVVGPIIGSWVAQHLGLEITFVSAGGIGLAIAACATLKQALSRQRSNKRASVQSS